MLKIACTTLDTSCLTCNSSSTCTGCSGSLVALGAACTTSCITGTYDYGGICTCKEIFLKGERVAHSI